MWRCGTGDGVEWVDTWENSRVLYLDRTRGMGLEGRCWLAAWDGWVLERSGEAARGEDKGGGLAGSEVHMAYPGSICVLQTGTTPEGEVYLRK